MRNVVKVDLGDTFYHIYGRGASKRTIFKSESDYAVFLNLIKRYLSSKPQKDSSGRLYKSLASHIQLLAYCLMPNHFHLLVYQIDQTAMSSLMHAVLSSYSSYFNTKYGQSGSLLESPYKAVRVDDDRYLMHISRYIHRNPRDWRDYSYSSIHNYEGKRRQDWVKPSRIQELFPSFSHYIDFLEDLKSLKRDVKHGNFALANK